MSGLNSIQFKILNSLYFEESFETLLEEVGESEPVVADELKTMIDKRLVKVLQYDESKGRYSDSFYYDADNLRDFYYRATNQGVSLHSAGRIEE